VASVAIGPLFYGTFSMRTEVKVGLIAGLVLIGGLAIYLSSKGSSPEQPADNIPWTINPEQGKSKDAAAPAGSRGGVAKSPAKTQPPTAAKPAEPKTDLTRRTLPPPVTRTPDRPPTSQPAPVAARPRPALPPVAATQRTVVTPTPEPRIPAPTETETSEVPAPKLAPAAPRETTPAEPADRRVPAEPSPAPDSATERPLRVGPLPLEKTPTPPATASDTSPAQPDSATAGAAPGVPVPPRRPESAREDTSARIRDAAKPRPEPIRYTVEDSDTLTYIARQKYGDGKYWTKIRDANPGINPDHLLVGQVLILPPKDELTGAAATPGTAKPGAADTAKLTPPRDAKEPAAAKLIPPSETKESAAAKPPSAGDNKDSSASKPDSKAARKTYVVAAGDSLATIARNVLGDGSRWREIYELNKDKIKNPDVLLEGTELKLPANGAKAAPPGGTKPAPASTSKPAPASGTKLAPASATKPAPASGTKPAPAKKPAASKPKP
jgi:nucleoid-associated protein YgaU